MTELNYKMLAAYLKGKYTARHALKHFTESEFREAIGVTVNGRTFGWRDIFIYQLSSKQEASYDFSAEVLYNTIKETQTLNPDEMQQFCNISAKYLKPLLKKVKQCTFFKKD